MTYHSRFLGLMLHNVKRGDSRREQHWDNDCKHAQSPSPAVWDELLGDLAIDKGRYQEWRCEKGSHEASPLQRCQIGNDNVGEKVKTRLAEGSEAHSDDVASERRAASCDDVPDSVEYENQKVGRWSRSYIRYL